MPEEVLCYEVNSAKMIQLVGAAYLRRWWLSLEYVTVAVNKMRLESLDLN